MESNNEKTKKITKVKTSTKKKKPKKSLKEKLSIVVLVLMILSIVAVSSGFIYIQAVISKAPDIEIEKVTNKEGSKIYFENGELLASLATFERENISFDEMSHNLVDAFLAIEDARFFTHNGFDLPRFTRALFNNIKSGSLGEGASTFSMQLIDNSYQTYFNNMINQPFLDAVEQKGLTPGSFDYKIERLQLNIRKINAKIQEIGMALDLETIISKQQILENYLNKIYFGAGSTRGVQNAALYYFNKPASDLLIPEAAFLAGVINAPSNFNPWANLEAAKARTKTVIEQMHYHGFITKEEHDLAQNVNLEDLLVDPGKLGLSAEEKYVTAINTVIEEAKSLGYNPYNTPMHIYTSIRKDVQDTVEAIQNEETAVKYPNELMQTSMVSLENNTGRIVAIGGGRHTVLTGYNRATEANIQPASTVKPFLSYALAFEYLGWSTSHVVEDAPAFLGSTNHVLRNADGNYRGEVTLGQAVAMSYNLPAYSTLVRIDQEIGAQRIREYLQNLGFRQDVVNNYDVQYSIGGGKFAASPLEVTAAHATLYSQGNYVKPHIIDKIVTNDSDPYESSYVPVQALSPEAAYLVSRLTVQSVSVPEYSRWNYMGILARRYPVFAKTGTSDYGDHGLEYNIPRGAQKDKWMVASTSQYTTGVWVGFDGPVKDKTTYFTASYSALNIPGNTMKLLLDALEKGQPTPTDLPRPNGVTDITHIIATYPYASVVDGMDPKYITTGQIKKEYATLSSLDDNLDIEKLEGFRAAITNSSRNNHTLTLEFDPYPGKIGLDPQYDISLRTSSGEVVVAATGTRLFKPAWLYGGVRYKADIYIDNVLSQTVVFSENTGTANFTASPNQKVKVCGYYGYEKSDKRDPSIPCVDLTVTDTNVAIPDFKTTYEVNDFINQNGLTKWTFSPINAPKVDMIGKIDGAYRGSQNIMGTSIKNSTLDDATDVRFYADYKVTLPINKTLAQVKQWAENLGITLITTGVADTDIIIGYEVNNANYNGGTTIDLSALATVKVKK